MAYISKENALIYYDELLKNYNYDTRYLYLKVPCLKSIMENEILKEVTGISHFKNPYELGQLKWLNDKSEKRNKNGDIIGDGFIPQRIIRGIEYLFVQRNTAEHDQKMSIAAYLGLFDTVADTINFFSGIDILKEIKDICEGKSESDELTININNDLNEKQKISNKNDCTDFYFVNTGINDDRPSRDWANNIKYKYISAGNDIRYINRIRSLKKGDKIFAYTPGIGYVGWGIVEEEAVLVKEFVTDEKKLVDLLPDDHKWRQEKPQNIDEWIVRVDWKEKVEEKNAVPNNDNPFPYINTVCPLKMETLNYLKKVFDTDKGN